MTVRKVFLLLFAIHLILSFHVADVNAVRQLWKRFTNWLKGDKPPKNPLPLESFEFHGPKNLTIYAATWNVNSRLDREYELQDWLCAEAVHKCAPDIYAIAFQELRPLHAMDLMIHDTYPDEFLIKTILENLCGSTPEFQNYQVVESARLAGMMLIVFIRKDLFPNVLKSSTHSVATGVILGGTQMGNKGGVGVSMQINDAHICFVNSHLTAHDHNVHQRNTDQNNIEHGMIFKYNERDIEVQKSINDHDKIFWMGDLNYRLKKCPPHNVFDMHDVNYMRIVDDQDQLCEEMRDRRVFLGYHEGEIKFKPTYKYDPGTDDWDSSDKKRNPAWCDRILSKGACIRQYAYNSVPRLKISDHKPIYGLFETEFIIKIEKKTPTRTGAMRRK